MTQADKERTVDRNEIDTQFSTLSRRIEGDGECFRAMVELLPVSLAVLRTVDGKILLTNRCLRETLGVPQGLLVDRDLGYIFPNISDRRRLKKAAAENGGVCGMELRGRREDGTPLWFSVWQRRIVFHGRECMLTILVDVTQKKAEESRQRQKRKALKRLLESSDRDRELIACELHDGLLQQITAAVMRLEAARRAINKGKANPIEQIEVAAGLVREAINEARSLIDGVRPPDLDRVGLVGALTALAEKTAKNSGIRIDFVHRFSAERLDPHLEATVYRIVQESLNNVWRHSNTDKARVELTADAGRVAIVVRDWGMGFDPAQVDEDRFGMTSIRERARLFGGSLTIHSAPSEGTTISVEFPLNESLSHQDTRRASSVR